MKARHFLTISDLDPSELQALIRRAEEIKADHQKGILHQPLQGKTLGLIFSKSSTRTRISFQTAMAQLGGTSFDLTAQDLQLSRGEDLSDTARVISGYLNGLVIRTFSHNEVLEWASVCTIPVMNGLTDLHHPCQILGDLLTIKEQFKTMKGLILTYIGDGNNIAHSLIEGAARTGITLRLACPKGYAPDESILKAAQKFAKTTGSRIEVNSNPELSASNADILYTDVWVSMGQEEESKKRLEAFQGYQLNQTLLKLAKPSARVMHCLPAYRGQEITAEVLEGPQSIVWTQAENRLHAQKALLESLL